MGAWGTGIFDNDDAMDWIGLMIENGDIEQLREGVNKIIVSNQYLQSPDCCRALASAEIIAAIKNKDYSFLPDLAKQWILTFDIAINPKIIYSAQEAIQMVKEDSELKDLWAKSNNLNEWIKVVQDLEDRLKK